MTRSPIFAHAADLYRQMRAEFDVVLEAAYAAAEEGTHGKLLNERGRTAPVDAYSLLTGPWSRVLKYGSPELIEWFEIGGRPSVAQFEREWFAARQSEPEPDAGWDELVEGSEDEPFDMHVPQPPHCLDPGNHSQPCQCSALQLVLPDYDVTSPEYKEALRRFLEAGGEPWRVL